MELKHNNINIMIAVTLFVATVVVAALVQFFLQQWGNPYGVPSPSVPLDDAQLTVWYEIRGIVRFIPAVAAYALLFAMWRHLPGRWWFKGVLFTLLLLTIKSQLIRLLIMGAAVASNSPLRTATIMLHEWVAALIWGLGFAFIIYWLKKREVLVLRPPDIDTGRAST